MFAPLRIFGHRPAAVPDGLFPIRQPRLCDSSQPPVAIPPILWQTGRGGTIQAHNGPRATVSLSRWHAKLAAEGIQPIFHSDAAARAFIAQHCPYGLRAYDCLRPPSYRADLWRYCVLWTRGGYFMDAEDLPLVPLTALRRPCDPLILVRDQCPEKNDRLATKPCKEVAVQISFMIAVPRHPFFHCALAMAIRNIEFGVHGKNDLDLTGPVLAGACLRKLHRVMNYSMALTLATDVQRSRGGVSQRKALYMEDGTSRAISLHAFDARHGSNGTRANGYVDYSRAWVRQGAFSRNCSLSHRPRHSQASAEKSASAAMGMANVTKSTSTMSGRAAFQRISQAIEHHKSL